MEFHKSEKIKWIDNDFYYTFDKGETITKPNYFKFFDLSIQLDETHYLEIKTDYTISFITGNQIMIKGPFDINTFVKINELNFKYEEYKEEEPTPEPTPEIDERYKPVETDEEIYIKAIEGIETVDIIVKKYTNETYPDMHFFKEKNTVPFKDGKAILVKKEKNIIYRISITDTINSKVYELDFESEPAYYFSSVKGLKDFIKSLNIHLSYTKTDLEIKKLIQEKSMFLKTRFGLTINETTNVGLFPALKKVVDIYCLENLLSWSFINGDFATSGDSSSKVSLKLNDFEVKGNAVSSNPNTFTTELVRSLKKDAEDSLYNSLTRLPNSFKGKDIYELSRFN